MFCKLFLLLTVTVNLAWADTDSDCGSYHRDCGLKAGCVNGECECKTGLTGAPLVECVADDKYQCVLQADPHLVAFNNAKANLHFPCKYRLTRLQTPLKDATPGLSFCSFEVFGFNEIVGKHYFTSGVEISLAIGDLANQIFKQVDIIKYEVSSSGVQDSTGANTEWGTGVHATWKGVTVDCEFYAKDRFAVLRIPRCGFTLKFRPYNASQASGPQKQVPAISIVVEKGTKFGQIETGRYPESLCGEGGLQGDTDDLYKNRIKSLGVKNTNLALVLDALNQKLQQESITGAAFTKNVLQDKDACQKAVDVFSDCKNAEQKAQAINLCGRLLIKGKFVRCMGIQVLEAFNGCVRAVCKDRTAGCNALKGVTNGCILPRRVRKYCT